MAMFYSPGSDPFSSGLPNKSAMGNVALLNSFFEWPTLPELPKLPSLSDLPGVGTARDISTTLGKLTSAKLWERIGFVILGLLIIGAALFMLGGRNLIAATVVQGAVSGA